MLSKGVKKLLKICGNFRFLNLKTKIAVSNCIKSDNLSTFNLLWVLLYCLFTTTKIIVFKIFVHDLLVKLESKTAVKF